MKHKPSFIENIAEKLGLIENLHSTFGAEEIPHMNEPGELSNYPPPEKWDDWTEYEAKSGQKREKKNYTIVPTTCFNCESGCGLLSYIDKDTNKVRKFEGNPYHPGSRGRNCAKGPATINQINDVDRILYPMKRKGNARRREWERVSWDEVLDDIAGRIRKALIEEDAITKSFITSVVRDTKVLWTAFCKSGALTGIIRTRIFVPPERVSVTRCGTITTDLRPITPMRNLFF